jgi:long-chain acyl-CoA synthetase
VDAKALYLSRPWTRFYEPGVLPEAAVPLKSVPQAFDEAAGKFADKTAIVFYGRSISYRELRESADRLAGALTRLGLRKGERVALYLLNSPQFVIAYFAVLKCGGVVTPISPVYTSHEVRFQLDNSGARIVVCQDILFDKIEKCGAALDQVIVTSVAEYLPPLKKLFGGVGRVFGGAAAPVVPRRDNVHAFQALLSGAEPTPPKVEIDPRVDVAALPYTGGTTGNPKGVVLTHYNLIAAQVASRSAFPSFEEGREVIIAFLPFFHIYGQVVIMLSGLTQGHTLVLFTAPDTEAILEAISKYGVSVFYGVPTLYEYLKDHKDTGKVDWKRLKLILSGADTLHESTAKDWTKRTGAAICEGYGLSETCAISHINPHRRLKPGSFGLPVTNMMAAVIDPDTRAFVPAGETGELVLAGPSVMQGYWNNPEETAKAFVEADGRRWLRTGDIVRMDDEGYFHFYDRSKDLIKYKGYSVFAKDIEDVLYAHPAVKAAGVIGVPDPAVGQRIKAIVVPQPESRGKLNEEDILAWCREKLAAYKVPHIIEFRGELPKTDVGKVSRRELREEHAA